MAKSFKETLQAWYGGVEVDIHKSDDPLLTSSNGAKNVIYGAYAFNQYNNAAVSMGYLPKFEAPRAGWRVRTGNAGATASGGLSENADMPDSVKPTIAEISADPKEHVHKFEVSTRLELQRNKDDMYGTYDEDLKSGASDHAKHLNEMLWVNVTTPASDDMESIDRVCSSYSEVSNCGDVDSNDSDIYSLDRDGGSSYVDAVVDHNSNTDRALELDMIRELKADIMAYGSNPTAYITDQDTLSQIEALVETKVRYTMGTTSVAPGVNGLERQGAEAGIQVAELFGLPLISDADVTSDGTGRIYCLDTNTENEVPKLGIGFWKRTELIESKNLLITDKLQNEFAYYTSCELYAKVFRHNGKIRDLSA